MYYVLVLSCVDRVRLLPDPHPPTHPPTRPPPSGLIHWSEFVAATLPVTHVEDAELEKVR